MFWIELAVCHVGTATVYIATVGTANVCIATVGIATVCIATERQNTSIIRMSAKIHYQLHQVCLSVFLSAWKESATTGRIFVKCNIYIYEDF